MIKKYYDPIKGLYVDVLHLGQDYENISPASLSVHMDEICKCKITRVDKEGFKAVAEDFIFNTQSFVFCNNDYIVFDKKHATIKVIPDASDELKIFMEEYLEIQ